MPTRPDTTHPDDITPRELAALLGTPARPVLLDVREPHEWAVARLPEARLAPLDSLPAAARALDRAAPLVVYCHHGVRSDAAAAWLRDHGFSHVRNLLGGIDRWSVEVDPTVRRY